MIRAKDLVSDWSVFQWCVSPKSYRGNCYPEETWPALRKDRPNFPIIYAHYNMEQHLATPEALSAWKATAVLEPQHLLYLGERESIGSFDNGPVNGYKWLKDFVKSQPRSLYILSLIWELKGACFEKRDPRITLEHLIHQDLFARYFNCSEALRYNAGMQFKKKCCVFKTFDDLQV